MANNASDEFNPGYFTKLPNNLKKMVKAVGFPDFIGMDDDEQLIYERVKHGRCMTCNGVMGEHANFIVTRHGIVGGYCGGQCHSDMAILGFLQEQHDDLTSAIAFRGGKGDTNTEIDENEVENDEDTRKIDEPEST